MFFTVIIVVVYYYFIIYLLLFQLIYYCRNRELLPVFIFFYLRPQPTQAN